MFNISISKKISKGVRNGLAALLTASIIGCTTPNSVSIATTQKLIQHERNNADLEIKTFKLDNGYTLVYAENENKTGKPLLLVHGFGGNKDNFIRIARHFKDYHVVIPDLLGFGNSDKPEGEDYQAEAQAKRLHQLMQAKGMTKDLHIGGNSMGGTISTAYTAMYPDEVASLWLIDSAGFLSVGMSDYLKGSTLDDNPLLVENYRDFEELTDFVMSRKPFLPTAVKAVMAQERIDNRELEGEILKQIVVDSVEERAKIIAENKIPTLVVWGAEDKVIKPETAEFIAEIIPQAQVIMMQGIGHVPMLEAVKQTADDYKEFREGINKK